jgi:acetyltransferase-like isoleucine patch superfamily enzyme
MLNDIKKIYLDLRSKKKTKYKRSLSFGDYFTDREERAKFENFGKGTTVYDNVLILGNVSVGTNTWIGPNVILDGRGKLEIGDHCTICAGVHIYTHDSLDWAVKNYKIKKYKTANVKIGNNVYIGPNSIISKGVKIGDRSVIGALSYVNKSFIKNSKIYGIPAK